MKKTLLLSIFASLLLSGCFGGQQKEETWTSLIYPDKANEKRSKKHGVYKTLQECQVESKKELENLGLTQRGTYQCGLNCTYHEGMKLDICEQLSK
ncbi:hypothetical protein [Halarcobacter bivalviorum]|uniref:Lipoprotein n=1 Tax=Halarcobacter bivalviorum TaxID=663364 RepID=A0AAX2AC11_9BACT|nr:hypothetical protein [Halarcobacter bivalviorum]AXH12461.1 hypothetical protein ABIV_1466 [Halarcobacter bivalviorum]RXK10613.1 hypothetical protein CRV05_04865 [Halarcobacter bivalviorum]